MRAAANTGTGRTRGRCAERRGSEERDERAARVASGYLLLEPGLTEGGRVFGCTGGGDMRDTGPVGALYYGWCMVHGASQADHKVVLVGMAHTIVAMHAELCR